ncbi:MAG: transposase [Rhodobacteraceae bacterium]|nr:transposase [Paracoccaceae bacterium]MCY4141237.1 transposase [Paracoccaceae bacterium]
MAIKVPHGPVVEAMMERGFAVHSLNPKQLDRFRDRHSPADTKDDSRDAHSLADALRTDSRFFRRLAPNTPELSEKGTKEFLFEIFRHNIGSHEFCFPNPCRD